MTRSRATRRAIGFLLLVCSVPAASPQAGIITGQLSLLERAGAARRDMASAVIYLEAVGTSAQDGETGAPAEALIAMRGREFVPHTAVVRRGGSVRFPNQDPFSHNVFSNTEPVLFDLGLYRRGTTRAAAFDTPGVYPIYCNIHARMVSYVISVPTRHVTQADADGRFTLSDVPVGSYRVHVWHERATPVTQDVTVAATGAVVRAVLDARGYIAGGAHLNKFGMPYSSTRSDRY